MTSSLPHAGPYSLPSIIDSLYEPGFAFLPATYARPWLEAYGLCAWPQFAASWDHLPIDHYMADGGRYRRRRYGTFTAIKGTVTQNKQEPHYQSTDYNRLNGGIERWFAPITQGTCQHPAFTAILKASAIMADQCAAVENPSPKNWHMEVHQFRIEATRHTTGSPTPEGMHRDGVEWVFVFMIKRTNIKEGITNIHALDGIKALGSFTLTNPLDTAIVNDRLVYHGVTPVTASDPNLPAYRDVLVVTLRCV